MNLDFFDGDKTTVSGNTFIQDGTAISIGNNAVNLQTRNIKDNSYDAVDTDFNFQNLLATQAISIDLGKTNNQSKPHDITLVLGGAANDVITGTSGADYIVGNAGNDLINGGDGNDSVLGGSGDRKSTRLNSSHVSESRMPSSA